MNTISDNGGNVPPTPPPNKRKTDGEEPPIRKRRYTRKTTPVKNDSKNISSIIIRFPQNAINGGGGDGNKDLNLDDFEIPKPIDNRSKYFDGVNDDDLIPINKELNSIDDLIELGKTYKKDDKKKYTLDMVVLNKLVEPLENLKKMVGMKSVKETIVNLILYNIQNFEKRNSSMLHTIIEGSPGTGKTEVAKIIADIYLKMGILKNDKFKSVKRNDLVGQYLGHTANKTQEVINSIKGGVLFIDEAYSLGNPEGRDSYSKECIDIINQNLSEGKCDFVCIIAGYPDALKNSFFSYNQGLERRFPYRFKIDDYDEKELCDIFIKIVKENKLEIYGKI